MKKSEKEALKKAFNIPEPQNKDSFAAKYEELIKKMNADFVSPFTRNMPPQQFLQLLS